MNDFVLELEKYHVYYSSPLDLDFAMLEKNPDLYKATAGEGHGPRINDNEQDADQRIAEAVHRSLKKEGGKGNSYSDSQKMLMAWYNYLFLGKGKPITHILALADMPGDEVHDCTPKFIERLEADVLKQLDGDKIDG